MMPAALTRRPAPERIGAMADLLTLDVIDRPAGGVLGTTRYVRALRRTGAPGLRAVLQLGTARFNPRPWPAATPRRVAVLAVWEDGADTGACWSAALGGLRAGAREHWHVEAEVVRAAFSEPWRGWTPHV